MTWKSDFRDLRVTLMGLGRHGGGVAAARFLAQRGAVVTITDLAPAEQLTTALAALADLPITRYSLGAHQSSDFDDAELLVINPAVRPDNPWLQRAHARNIPWTTEVQLFLDHCPARVIAVTGSNGKSTTATMIDHLLRASGQRSWLGGNIGRSLLDNLPNIRASDWVVLELSSFQLARLQDLARPIDVAVILNCTPNHLDWHGDFVAYQRAKQQLLALQGSSGMAILGDDNVASWRALARGTVIEPVPQSLIPPLQIAGDHQRANAACAAAAALAAGAAPQSIESLAQVHGLAHRIELVAQHEQVRVFDDSKATTPEAALAAVRAVPGPIWLLAGGDAKGVDLTALAAQLVEHTAGVACYGRAGPTLAEALRAANPRFPSACVATLAHAFDWCWSQCAPGDAILLSPGCASHDQYADYVARAADFRVCVARASEPTARRPIRSVPGTCSPPETSKSPPR